MANLGGMDALSRYALTKINDIDAMPANAVQLLVVNGTANSGTAITSKNMGNPNSIDVHVLPTVTGTLAIQHSYDGKNYIHDAANDIAVTAATPKIVTIKAAKYIQITPSATQTAGFFLTIAAKY